MVFVHTQLKRILEVGYTERGDIKGFTKSVQLKHQTYYFTVKYKGFAKLKKRTARPRNTALLKIDGAAF